MFGLITTSAASSSATANTLSSRIPSALLHQRSNAIALCSQLVNTISRKPKFRYNLFLFHSSSLPLPFLVVCAFFLGAILLILMAFLFQTSIVCVQVNGNSSRSSCSAIKAMAESHTLSVPNNEPQTSASGMSECCS